MLLLLGTVKGLFLFHRFTNQFIGEDIPNRPGPVTVEKAVDLRPLRGNKMNTYITLENQNRRSFDIRYGASGTFLDYYSTHSLGNQSFRLVLTAANTFLLLQSGRCMNWTDSRSQFLKTKCKETSFGEFDIFYETAEQNTPRKSEPASGDDNKEFIELFSAKRGRPRPQRRPGAGSYTVEQREESGQDGGGARDVSKHSKPGEQDQDSNYSLKITKLPPRHAKHIVVHDHETTDSLHCHESNDSSDEGKISSETLDLINSTEAAA